MQLYEDGKLCQATVKSQSYDSNGVLIGTYNNNPLLYTRVYEVEFDDDYTEVYSAKCILEKLYDQADNYGKSSILLISIVGHRKDEVVTGKYIHNPKSE